MLVDPIFKKPGSDPAIEFILGGIANGVERKRLCQGVYQIGHFSFEYEIVRSRGTTMHDLNYPEIELPDGSYFGSYGVCDNYEQVLEKCPAILADPRRFVISVTKIDKNSQPSEGGWRWHKWGEYIGTQEPTCEYIYDEPIIEEVYCYHIYEI